MIPYVTLFYPLSLNVLPRCNLNAYLKVAYVTLACPYLPYTCKHNTLIYKHLHTNTTKTYLQISLCPLYEATSTELQARIASELREDGATLRRVSLSPEGSIQIDATYA